MRVVLAQCHSWHWPPPGNRSKLSTDADRSTGARHEPAPEAEDCANADLDALLDGPPVPLPTALSGTLCSEGDALSLVVEGLGSQGVAARVRARLGEASGPYSLTLFEVEGSALEPLLGWRSSNALELSEQTPEWVFAGRLAEDTRIALQLAGPPGAVDVALDEVVAEQSYRCDPQYESVDAGLPTEPLPASFVTELCSGRDTRVLAIDVIGGRPVTVTLENRDAMDAAHLSVLQLSFPREPR